MAIQRHKTVSMIMLNIVGDSGSTCVTLQYPSKGGGMVSYARIHHGEPSTLVPEDTDCLGEHAVALQDIQVPVSVQGTIRLLEVQ